MTGAYQTWQYGPAGWLVDLNEYIKDPAKTNPNYNWDDVLPNLRASTAWSGVPGAALGGDGRQAVGDPVGLRAQLDRLQPAHLRHAQADAADQPARPGREGGEDHQGRRRPLRHRRARLAQLGDDPSGLSVGLRQLRRHRLRQRPAAS